MIQKITLMSISIYTEALHSTDEAPKANKKPSINK